MTRITEKEGIDAALLGIRIMAGNRMDSIDLGYEEYAAGEKLPSIRMNYADFNTGAVPLVDLIQYVMKFHPELLEEAAQNLQKEKGRRPLQDLLLELPELPGYKTLIDEITTLPAFPKDGRARLLLKGDMVRESVSASTGYSNMHHYVVVIPTADEAGAGKDVVIEGWGTGASEAVFEKYSFSDMMEGTRNLVRNEIEDMVRQASAA